MDVFIVWFLIYTYLIGGIVSYMVFVSDNPESTNVDRFCISIISVLWLFIATIVLGSFFFNYLFEKVNGIFKKLRNEINKLFRITRKDNS